MKVKHNKKEEPKKKIQILATNFLFDILITRIINKLIVLIYKKI